MADLVPAALIAHGRKDCLDLRSGNCGPDVGVLASLAGTETIFGDEIVALDEGTDHVAVQLKSGGRRCFDLVVGADGLHSSVRRLAFGPQDHFEKRLGYVVAASEADGYRPRDEYVYVIYNEPGRMVGRMSLRNDRTLFLFVFLDNGAPMPDLATQKARLRAEFAGSGFEERAHHWPALRYPGYGHRGRRTGERTSHTSQFPVRQIGTGCAAAMQLHAEQQQTHDQGQGNCACKGDPHDSLPRIAPDRYVRGDQSEQRDSPWIGFIPAPRPIFLRGSKVPDVRRRTRPEHRD